MRYDIESFNIYMLSEVLTELDLLFNDSFTFKLCGTL